MDLEESRYLKVLAPFETQVLGWLFLHNIFGKGLNTRLTIGCFVVCCKFGTVKHVPWNCKAARMLWAGLLLNRIFSLSPSLKGGCVSGQLDDLLGW